MRRGRKGLKTKEAREISRQSTIRMFVGGKPKNSAAAARWAVDLTEPDRRKGNWARLPAPNGSQKKERSGGKRRALAIW